MFNSLKKNSKNKHTSIDNTVPDIKLAKTVVDIIFFLLALSEFWILIAAILPKFKFKTLYKF